MLNNISFFVLGRKVIYIVTINILLLIFCSYSVKGQQDNYKSFGSTFAQKLKTPDYSVPSGPFKPTWESLSGHVAVPKWFRDAKFGIYFHYGVYTVPAYGDEWYPRRMYNKESDIYKHHVETYGSPLKFGYPDFVPMFKGQQFDADRWAKLFKEAGAKFAGPVAEHHDGFAMWNSSWTPWNAMNMGPHRDVVGELAKAIREQGLRFSTTFHHAKNNLYEKDGEWVGHYSYIKKYFPTLLNDSKRALLYGYIPHERFIELWRGELEEVMKNYQPSLVYFDHWLNRIPDSVKTKYLAYYYNKANQWGKQVMITSKNEQSSDQFPKNIGVTVFERGRANEIRQRPWLTSDAIGDNSWGYVKDLKLKNASYLIHELIDVVSKNGQFLLDVSPMSNGVFPKDQKSILYSIGQWLDQNGEAIYGTRPWKVFGEGPTRLQKGGAFVGKINYSPEDIRYTQKGDIVYAIQLGWPGPNKKFLLNAWKKDNINLSTKIQNVSVLGSDASIKWQWNENGLSITSPSKAPTKKAIVYKIFTKEIE